MNEPTQADIDLVRQLTGPDAEATKRLHARLVEQAQQDGLLDIAYRTIDSPVGQLLLAGTEAGLVRVAYQVEDHDRVLQALSDDVSPRILHAPGRLDVAAGQLEEYFDKRRTSFTLALDMRLAHGFRREVLAHLPEIGYGRTASYTEVAVASGRPKAVRAVGTACARNPLPVVVPCHRVLRSDGSPGGYVGGVEAKAELLRLEGAA